MKTKKNIGFLIFAFLLFLIICRFGNLLNDRWAKDSEFIFVFLCLIIVIVLYKKKFFDNLIDYIIFIKKIFVVFKNSLEKKFKIFKKDIENKYNNK